jgi:hypothetical protein
MLFLTEFRKQDRSSFPPAIWVSYGALEEANPLTRPAKLSSLPLESYFIGSIFAFFLSAEGSSTR